MNDMNCRIDRRHVSFHLSGEILNQIQLKQGQLTMPDVLAALVNVAAIVVVRSSADPVKARETADAFVEVFDGAISDRLAQRWQQ